MLGMGSGRDSPFERWERAIKDLLCAVRRTDLGSVEGRDRTRYDSYRDSVYTAIPGELFNLMPRHFW